MAQVKQARVYNCKQGKRKDLGDKYFRSGWETVI